jgi:MFS family permease
MLFGPLGDRVGRKPILMLSSTITATCSLASSYAPTFEALVLLRFGVGIGVGGTVVPFDMLAELTPSHFRGAFLLYVGYFWTIGTSATPVLAWYAMQLHGSWRLLLLLCSIPGFVSLLFAYLWVPESPRWLMTKGRSEEALDILKDGATSNYQTADIVYPPGTTIVLSREEVDDMEKMSSVASLFLPEWRFLVICMLLVWAFLDLIYWGNIQVVTLVFAEYDHNIENFQAGSQYAYDYGAIIGSSLAEIIGQTAVLILIDRVGRVATQAVAYAAGALSVFCLCFVAYIEDTGSETERYILVLLAFLARMFIMAATSLTW